MPGAARLVALRASRGAVDGPGRDATESTAFAAGLGSLSTPAGVAHWFAAARACADRAFPPAIDAASLTGALPAGSTDPSTADPMSESVGSGVASAVQTPRNTNAAMTCLGEQRGQDEHGDRGLRRPGGQCVGVGGQVRIEAAQGEPARRGHHHLGRGSDIEPRHRGCHPPGEAVEDDLGWLRGRGQDS